MITPISGEVGTWLANYKEESHALLEADPDFRRWLEEDYVPIAGGWQY